LSMCGIMVDMKEKDEITGKFTKTHDKSRTRIYFAWQRMKQRCYDTNYSAYQYWGGRGIKVCDRWLDSFDNFYDDMGDIPKGRSLDRINNDVDYCKSNCRWATPSVQAFNKRISSKNKSGSVGVFWDKSSNKWRSVITFNKKTQYLGSFDTMQEAIESRKTAEEGISLE